MDESSAARHRGRGFHLGYVQVLRVPGVSNNKVSQLVRRSLAVPVGEIAEIAGDRKMELSISERGSTFVSGWE